MVQRAILCPTNDDVDLINEQVMAMIADSGRESREYFSADSILEQDNNMAVLNLTEFLDTIKASGLAPHRLVGPQSCSKGIFGHKMAFVARENTRLWFDCA